MVSAVRSGQSLRFTARQFGVSTSTVKLWLERAQDKPLELVNWEDESHSPFLIPNKTTQALEERILQARQWLTDVSDLGEFGAGAIRALLQEQGEPKVPSVATINRILAKQGIFDRRKRTRRKPPVPGWYLPEVAARNADIDETDFVEGLYLEADPSEYFVLNILSLHGSLCASRLTTKATSDFVMESLLSHWRTHGLPAYVQFDNGLAFTGPRQYPDVIGRVIRLCLSLGVTPVFAVPREFGIQSAIESYNNRWQQKVWKRQIFADFEDAKKGSERYVLAVQRKHRQRQESAPFRRPFPEGWEAPTMLPRKGKIVFLRRTIQHGEVMLLGHTTIVAPHWCNRLVRCEVDLAHDSVCVYGLRRIEPEKQQLLKEWKYRMPESDKKT